MNSKTVTMVRRQLDIQGQNGNWNHDPYMHGMYNGLECALATIEGREPKYRPAPIEWLKDRTPPGFTPTVCDGDAQAEEWPGRF